MPDQRLKPVFALCGVTRNRSQSRSRSLPSYGPIAARDWNPDPQAPGGFRGLPWGVGDPAAAFLSDFEWAVIRVDDPDGPIAIPAVVGTKSVAAVKFQSGTVVYLGDRRGAIETLVQCGANLQTMSVKLALPGINGIADAGPYGVAVGGASGMARGADRSHVFVDDGFGGVAVAGKYGLARARCMHGIAVVREYGEAHAGEGGLAASCHAGANLLADRAGVAVAVQNARQLEVGAGGAAVALKGAGRIEGGPNSVVVVREAVPDRTQVRLGDGAIAVFRFPDSDGGARFAVAHAGPGGIEPDVLHVWTEGEFRKIEYRSIDHSDTEPDSESVEHGANPGGEDQDAHHWREMSRHLEQDGPLGNDAVVLCSPDRWGRVGEAYSGFVVEAEEWDPAPDSRKGMFGLAWGVGTPDLGARYVGSYEWLLVRVSDPVPVPVADAPSARLVKFAKGRVIYRGNPKAASDILVRLGSDPDRLVSRIVSAGPEGIARTNGFAVAAAGRGGWAISDFYAEAGPEGLARGRWAEAGDRGIAIDDWQARAGREGIAICDMKRHGVAEAGTGGAAIALGERYAIVEGTAAISLGAFGKVRAFDGGVAIGGYNSEVFAGRNGIAIAIGKCPGGMPGTLLVCRVKGEVRTAVVGEDGKAPPEFTDWVESRIREP